MVPFWDGDAHMAARLVRLLANLEPQFSSDTEFLLVSRGGASIGSDSLSLLRSKFTTHVHQSLRTETGWPVGCNSVSVAGFQWILHRVCLGPSPYKAIFYCAPDSCPLVRDALSYIHRRWASLSSRALPPYFAGALVPPGPDRPVHINSDCSILSTDAQFLSWLFKRCSEEVNNGGWDCLLAEEFRTLWGWHPLSGIRSSWQRPSFHESEWQELRDDGVSWLHGVKDQSLLMEAECKLLCS